MWLFHLRLSWIIRPRTLWNFAFPPCQSFETIYFYCFPIHAFLNFLACKLFFRLVRSCIYLFLHFLPLPTASTAYLHTASPSSPWAGSRSYSDSSSCLGCWCTDHGRYHSRHCSPGIRLCLRGKSNIGGLVTVERKIWLKNLLQWKRTLENHRNFDLSTTKQPTYYSQQISSFTTGSS